MFITKPFVRDRRIRFALVGCGRISANHFDALDRHKERAELVGVCDIDPQALEQAVARTGAPGFQTLDALLAGTDADIVILSTPSGLPADQATQVSAAGRLVMTEKPMATLWRDGKRMVQACDQAGVHLFVVKQNRRNATLQLLKHRHETRGVGGLFFDDLHTGFDHDFGYLRAVGDGFLDAYLPIVARRRDMPFGERERQFQLYRRGRYVEFNLVFDRGTLFGLQSGGRTESILMSLPPLVRWEYGYAPETGSDEAQLADYLLPRDWLSEGAVDAALSK